MKLSSFLTLLSFALVASAACPTGPPATKAVKAATGKQAAALPPHDGAAPKNAKGGAAKQAAAAKNATAIADALVADPNVNAAANNGVKGDNAAALAEEAVLEFESGGKVTATAASAQASAEVAKENAALKKAGRRRRQY